MPPQKGRTRLSHAHEELHEGKAFHAHFTRITDNTDDHRTGIGFIAPAALVELHMVITILSTSPAEFFLLEAPTIDAGEGSEIDVYNRNRNSVITSLITSQEVAPAAAEVTTWTETQIAGGQFSGGTELDYMILAGGEGKKSPGGVARGAQEWIMDLGIEYLIYLKNIGANVNTHYISLDWYEDTDLT